jgi:hypothetical protein
MECRDEDSILEHAAEEGKWPVGGAGVSEKLWINRDRVWRGEEKRRSAEPHLVMATLPPACDRSKPAVGLAKFVDHPIQPTE